MRGGCGGGQFRCWVGGAKPVGGGQGAIWVEGRGVGLKVAELVG